MEFALPIPPYRVFIWLLFPYPAPPCNTGNMLCVRIYIYTYTRTIDFSSLCAEEELNHAQARTAVGWSPAQGGESGKALQRNPYL